jgi:hypothetical protein
MGCRSTVSRPRRFGNRSNSARRAERTLIRSRGFERAVAQWLRRALC